MPYSPSQNKRKILCLNVQEAVAVIDNQSHKEKAYSIHGTLSKLLSRVDIDYIVTKITLCKISKVRFI